MSYLFGGLVITLHIVICVNILNKMCIVVICSERTVRYRLEFTLFLSSCMGHIVLVYASGLLLCLLDSSKSFDNSFNITTSVLYLKTLDQINIQTIFLNSY